MKWFKYNNELINIEKCFAIRLLKNDLSITFYHSFNEDDYEVFKFKNLFDYQHAEIEIMHLSGLQNEA